jgi:hypothetical protein
MNIKMNSSVATAGVCYRKGHKYTVADTIGEEWCRKGIASEIGEKKEKAEKVHVEPAKVKSPFKADAPKSVKVVEPAKFKPV